MTTAASPRVGSLDIAEAVSQQIGSFVSMDFFKFVVAEGDRVTLWYMNSGGKGPSFEVNLRHCDEGWTFSLLEHPPGTDQTMEIP